MKIAASCASRALPSEQEQLAAISSITMGNTDPLSLSSSSQGSLTSLQPHRYLFVLFICSSACICLFVYVYLSVSLHVSVC